MKTVLKIIDAIAKFFVVLLLVGICGTILWVLTVGIMQAPLVGGVCVLLVGSVFWTICRAEWD